MKITLLTYGTRGDVQPFVALGIGLKAAGHSVTLAAPAPFEGFVAGHGISFAALPGDPAELSRRLVDEVRLNPFRTVAALRSFAMPLAAVVMRTARAACQGADAIVHSFLLTLGGHALAREMGIPDFSAQTFPTFAPSRDFAAVGWPAWPLGPHYNRLTHALLDTLFFEVSRAAYPPLRRANPDLPARIDWPFRASRGRPPTPILAAISPHVFRRPADWPAWAHVTGYWFLGDTGGWEPPAALVHFLESGPPPVCIGFGSVVTAQAERLGEIARRALALSGLRGVLLGGWSDIGRDEPPGADIFRIDSAPHGWLFPRMAAVVHHGGAGTTAAALRAGVPGLLTPFSSDQPFWAGRVKRLGVAPAPIPITGLTAEKLAAALREAVSDGPMRARAASLGEAICAEDGVACAVEIIERQTAVGIA